LSRKNGHLIRPDEMSKTLAECREKRRERFSVSCCILKKGTVWRQNRNALCESGSATGLKGESGLKIPVVEGQVN
jgi:hypothetical protein